MKKKILIVFGTRPEAIKMAPVVRAFKAESLFEVTVCNTAQHREMTDQVLDFFSLESNYDLDIMQKAQSLNGLMSRLMEKLDQVLADFKPDLVLVHGDTTTCLAASLCSFHREIPIGHVEAGLRTYNFSQPFPEEMNRQVCDKLASLHFAPTAMAVSQLLDEKIDSRSIVLTGNTIVDAVQLALPLINDKNDQIQRLKSWIQRDKKIILVTGHRRENFGISFLEVIAALKELAQQEGVQLIYPVHLNPNVQDPVYAQLGNQPNIHLCAPLDYESFLWLMKSCDFMITDSGGVQEEATVLGKKVLLTRNTTERQEAVEAGFVKLVGTDKNLILKEARALLEDSASENSTQPYGDGTSSQKILEAVKNYFLE